MRLFCTEYCSHSCDWHLVDLCSAESGGLSTFPLSLPGMVVGCVGGGQPAVGDSVVVIPTTPPRGRPSPLLTVSTVPGPATPTLALTGCWFCSASHSLTQPATLCEQHPGTAAASIRTPLHSLGPKAHRTRNCSACVWW